MADTLSTESPVAEQSELAALAERVEAATGPDRGLDVAIAVVVDWKWPDWEPDEASARGQAEKHGLPWLVDRAANGMNSAWRGIPAYTSSLDAAMTLVPERWKPVIDLTIEPNRAELYPPDYDSNDWTLKETARGWAAMPALALTAAALRARDSGSRA
jgi:hypothetical protein